jgi:hypothetical protein
LSAEATGSVATPVSDHTIARRVVITSSVRSAPVGQIGGYFRVLDLEQGRVSFVAPVPESLYRAVDPNPRGGQRGGRGVSVHDGQLVLGNAERIFIFEVSWKVVQEIGHPLMANIHDLLAEERGLWVAATGCDALLLMDWSGHLMDFWNFRDDERLVRELGFPSSSMPPFDPSEDYRDPRLRGRTHTIHINSVARGSNGLLVGFGRVHGFFDDRPHGESVVVRLTDDGPRLAGGAVSIVHRRAALDVPNHNVAEVGELLVFNDTNRGCLVAHDLRLGEERSAVPIPGKPGFARGLARIGPNLWLVGSQEPFAVHAVDLDLARVVATYPLGGVERETVFAISPLPDEFDEPPQPAGDDPDAFWRRAAPGRGMTPIPTSRGGRSAPGRA